MPEQGRPFYYVRDIMSSKQYSGLTACPRDAGPDGMLGIFQDGTDPLVLQDVWLARNLVGRAQEGIGRLSVDEALQTTGLEESFKKSPRKLSVVIACLRSIEAGICPVFDVTD